MPRAFRNSPEDCSPVCSKDNTLSTGALDWVGDWVGTSRLSGIRFRRVMMNEPIVVSKPTRMLAFFDRVLLNVNFEGRNTSRAVNLNGWELGRVGVDLDLVRQILQ